MLIATCGIALSSFWAFFSLYCQFSLLYVSLSPLSFPPFSWKRFFQSPNLFLFYYSETYAKTLLVIASLISLTLPLIPSFWSYVFLWVVYYSFCQSDKLFLSYQWDSLLLECLLIAGLSTLAPFKVPYKSLGALLLFRLMFQSGWKKWQARNGLWRNLKALSYHLYTQPLPTPVAYYLSKLPPFFLKILCAGVLVAELVLPFFLFITPFSACILFIGLQVSIALCGNFGFFNLLTASLCLFVMLPTPLPAIPYWQELLFHLPLLFILFAIQLGLLFEDFISLPSTYNAFLYQVRAYRIAQPYGLFVHMTTTRQEILIEASYDSKNWFALPFFYKASQKHDGLSFIAPYHPRLDWQLWFSSFSSYSSQSYLHRLSEAIFEGTDPLLPKQNPPPRFLRYSLCFFRFSTLKEKKKSGRYWVLGEVKPYSPILRKS